MAAPQKHKVYRIQVDDIEVGHRLRVPTDAQVKALAESMGSEIGLRIPISVRLEHVPATEDEPAGNATVLVAGATRLAAAKLLGWEYIDATYFEGDARAARLWEIDENLARGELSEPERILHVKERKRIYEEEHPETKLGATGAGREKVRQVGEANPADRFTADTAAKTGRSERSIQRDAERGKKIDEDVLVMLAPHKVSGTILDQLKRMPVEQQRQWAADYIAQQTAPKPPPAANAKKQAKAAETKSLKEEANEKLAQLFADHIPGEHWDALKANLYAAGAKDIAREFERLIGVSVFDTTRSGRAA